MAEELKRIDPIAIPALFEKHEFTPAKNDFYFEVRGRKCGCINTILAVDAGDRDEAIAVAIKAVNGYEDSPMLGVFSGLNPDYSIGLACGWDGFVKPRRFREPLSSPEEQFGFEDGKAAREACEASMGVIDADSACHEEDDDAE